VSGFLDEVHPAVVCLPEAPRMLVNAQEEEEQILCFFGPVVQSSI
jgi:hypothetical protein